MGEALFELEKNLRSSKYKITREEEDILDSCKGKAVRDFTISASVASSLTWAALRKFGYGFRGSLSSGAALVTGMWRFDRSLNSCVDNILGMEGSRMQKELANLILTKHQHDPSRMQLINKHFYSEKVFDDSSSDRPISRWRHRNYFSDGVAFAQTSYGSDQNYDTADLERNRSPEPRQLPMRAGIELTADPLDFVFGYSGPPEEIHLLDSGHDMPSKRRSRKDKRTQKRHRTRHTEISPDTVF